jgi:hypothetical protein
MDFTPLSHQGRRAETEEGSPVYQMTLAEGD